ncbi:acrosin [Echinops telfairi]|uniref:Acrosin n=2 Tax=Echinops telfairi TaxID=9371 RepID=A0ABM0IIC8_ECHTE|nr:acrosin [Echinops telfairi]
MVEMLPTAILLVLAVSVVAKDNTTCDGPCGLRFRQNQQGGVRIVGGQTAPIGAWPWMVSVQFFTFYNSRRYHSCGGILLNSHWVLTAAHCFANKNKVYHWRLIFGASEVIYGHNMPVKPPMQERFVEKIVIHEKYSSALEQNDIALLKVTPPVPCGSFIGPACLPRFKAGPPTIPQACWVAGWGYVRESALRPSPILREARVSLIDLELCNSTEWYNGRIRSTQVCAGFPQGNIDTCQGDSGGPLMCKDNVENIFVVVGITSWGVGCARAKRPGVYTSTWSYLDWIASKIGSNVLHNIQPGTPPPPTPIKVPVRPPTAQSSSHPPWYYQRPPQPNPLHMPAVQPPPPPPSLPPPSPQSPPAHPPTHPHSHSHPQKPLQPPPPPPPPTTPSQALSFAKRLRFLIETLKGRSYYDIEEIEISEPASSL